MGEDKIQDANVTLNIERGSNVQFQTFRGALRPLRGCNTPEKRVIL
jgi:hypothetical protein